jgi:alpha/beta superfamily hydrolase
VVTQGQILERATLVPSGDLVLEALWHRGDRRPPLLMLSPAPDQGSMDHPVATEVTWAAARAGLPTLRFNFRGVGGSQGKKADASKQLIDAESALRVIQENTGAASIAVAALGASAATALQLLKRHPAVAGLCLISPHGIAAPDLARVNAPFVIIAEGESAQPPASLAAAVAEAGGRTEIIPGADARFLAKLPEVGKAVVRWLTLIACR